MSLNSLHLDAFQACAEVGHFTQAAKRLSITQSALSQRIKNLEAELEQTLFIRDRKSVRLTEAGERLLRYCQMRTRFEVEFLGELGEQSRGSLSGSIRIGAFSTVARSLVLPAVQELLVENPFMEFKLIVEELHRLPSLLRSGAIDFMILDERVSQGELEIEYLGNECNVLAERKNYRGEEIYLDHDEDDLTTARYFGLKTAKKLKRRYLDDIYGILDGLYLGLGKAVVPLHLIRGNRSLKIVNPQKSLKVPIYFHYFKEPFYTKAHIAARSALVSNIEKMLGRVN